MADVQDTTRPQAKRISKWALVGLGILWTLLVGNGSFLLAGLWSLGTGGYMNAEIQQQAVGVGNAIVVGGLLLALAPWLVGGLVLGVGWWGSRRPTPPQDIE